MTDFPRVSIVTPTKNMGDRLEACVRSVSAQNYPNIEHIVLDAVSTDGTVDFLRSQEHLRWVSEPDRGQSDAINKGFRIASGQILTWLNADDVLAPNAVRSVVELFVRMPNVGLVYGDLEIVERGKSRIERPPTKLTWNTFCRGNEIAQPGTFITASALESVGGGVDDTFNLTMDFELWLRLLKAGVVTQYLPQVLASFEVHSQSKTGSTSTLEFAREAARALEKHGDLHAAALVIDRWHSDQTILRLDELLRAGDFAEAQRVAAEKLVRLPPVLAKRRIILWIARLSPRAARILLPLRRR